MKILQDPRHQKRIKTVKKLFAWGFHDTKNKKVPIKNDNDFQEIVKFLEKIDQEILKSAPERSLKQINRIDLAILRLAVFELIIKKDAPYKVIVDEAVEIAKEYGADSTPAFINGVLGKIISLHNLGEKNTTKERGDKYI